MTSLADQSSMAVWPVWVWAVGVLILLVGFAAVTTIMRDPISDAPPADDAPVKPTEHCTYSDCNGPVKVHIHAGHDYYPFCENHGTPLLTRHMRKDGAA